MRLLHGTTLARAESIIQHGPDVNFVEPGGVCNAENFSFTTEGNPSALGESVAYAINKAILFPNERGPAVVVVDVPDDVVRSAVLEHLSLYKGIILYDEAADLNELVAHCGGFVQFDPGPSLNSLLSIWAVLVKEIRGVP